MRSSIAALVVISAIVGPSLYLAGASGRGESLAAARRAAARAHLSAADAAHRAGRPAEMREHLAAIPEADRDWVWGHLSLMSDRTAKVVAHGVADAKVIRFLAPGLRLAVLDGDGVVSLFDCDPAGERKSVLLAEQGRYTGLTTDSSHREMFLATNSGFVERRTFDGELVGRFPLPRSRPAAIADAADRTSLLAFFEDGEVVQVDTRDGRVIGRVSATIAVPSRSGDVSAHVQGGRLVVGHRSGGLAAFDLPLSNASYTRIENSHVEWSRFHAMRARGRQIACVTDVALRFGELPGKDDDSRPLEIARITTPDTRTLGPVTCLQGSVSNVWLTGHESGVLAKWNLGRGGHDVWFGHSQRVCALAWCNHLFWMASAGVDGTVRLWRPTWLLARSTSGGPIPALGVTPYGTVSALALGPRGQQHAIGYVDGVIQIRGGRGAVASATTYRHRGPVRDLRFDSTGARLISSGRDGTVRIFEGSVEIACFDAREHRPCQVCFGSSGAVVSAGDDGNLVLWTRNGSSRTAIALPEPCLELRSREAGIVVRGRSGAMYVWRVTDGRLTRNQDDPASRRLADLSPGSAFSVSSDGRWLAVAGAARGFTVVNAATGAEHVRLLQNSRGIRQLVWGPAGRRIAVLRGSHQVITYYSERRSWPELFDVAQVQDGRKLLSLALRHAHLRSDREVLASGAFARLRPELQAIVRDCVAGFGDEAGRLRTHARRVLWLRRGAASHLDVVAAALDRAIALVPDNAVAWWLRALTQLRRGHRDEARRACDRARQLQRGNDPIGVLIGGLVAAAHGDRTEARAALARVERRDEQPGIAADPGLPALLAELRGALRAK